VPRRLSRQESVVAKSLSSHSDLSSLVSLWDELLSVSFPSEITNLFITLKMETVCTSETSVCSETTWRYIPEGCHLNIRRRENLKANKLVNHIGHHRMSPSTAALACWHFCSIPSSLVWTVLNESYFNPFIYKVRCPSTLVFLTLFLNRKLGHDRILPHPYLLIDGTLPTFAWRDWEKTGMISVQYNIVGKVTCPPSTSISLLHVRH
jgi:hypothetical protein